ncbi:hypothetical protein H7849_05730 [Alloacidobacterium dinghuense]|uniref:Uncharacterized protein n=1 Tax=Alloacidobacterium dinghuense TaxID=2763107 RepID=A0A7G8BLM8_9BACT|nr:hypothetical protein [Alloacidobacterium dinghuense]QNI33448.1 hypothetical protein H7849_05730 [Alloacidobacterium dinghuense]
MNTLLKLATEAHGGIDRWSQLKTLKASLSVTGAIWHVKGRPDVLKDIRIELPIHEERLITHLVGQNKRFVFAPHQVVVEDEQGHLIENRDNPRGAFEGQTYETPWDDLHVAYFDSYALWTYLTIPFLYTYSGFVTEELPPWHEGGEIWRPLKAIFPENIASHTREQISYFGKDGLLRRHEYVVDVMGGARGLNYAYDYRQVGGIMVPTTRRVVAFDDSKRPIPDPVLVAIDIGEIAFS